MKAVALNISAWMLLPVMDGMAKHLSAEIHFLQVVWGRYFFMVIISLPLTYFFFYNHLKFPKNIWIQLIRSSFLFLSTVFFFFSISIISLAPFVTSQAALFSTFATICVCSHFSANSSERSIL